MCMQEAISPRQQVAINLTDVCLFGGLDEGPGVSFSKQVDAKGKPYWSVTFAKAGILDGAIKVYSPNFILVSWQTAIRDLPSTGREVCKAETQAREFLTNNFIKRFL